MKTSVAMILYEIDALAGMQSQAAQLAARLPALGCEVKVISTVAPRHYISRRRDPVRGAEDTPVIRIPTTRTPVFEMTARRWLARRGGVDVILAIGWHSVVHGVKIGANRVPVVARYGASGSHGDFAQLARFPAARGSLDSVSRHICITRDIEREVLSAGLPAERVLTIPNGVDHGTWGGSRGLAAMPFKKGPIVLFAGRLCRQKRVDILLDALALVVESLPGVNLVIAGIGPLEADLRAQASRLGLDDRTAFLGSCLDMPALYRASSILVLPSDSEGMSNVVLEALASGTPEVATRLPGTEEIARSEIEALLVEPGDPEALADAIIRVLGDTAIAERMVHAGLERVRGLFGSDRMAETYAALLAEVAAEATT